MKKFISWTIGESCENMSVWLLGGVDKECSDLYGAKKEHNMTKERMTRHLKCVKS